MLRGHWSVSVLRPRLFICLPTLPDIMQTAVAGGGGSKMPSGVTVLFFLLPGGAILMAMTVEETRHELKT